MTTLGLKNVNMLSKERYDNIVEPATDELWAVEIKTYSDADGNWYKIYPDGSCEQGGILSATSGTISFMLPMADNKYAVVLHGSISARTVSSVNFSGATTGASWEVKGKTQKLYSEVVDDGNYHSEALYTDEAKTNRVYFLQKDNVSVSPSWDTYTVTFRVPMQRIDYFTCTPGGYAGVPTPSLTGYTVSGQNVDYVRNSPYTVIGA